MIKLGDYNTLRVVEEARRRDEHSFTAGEVFGIYLDGGDEGDILMPKKYVPEGTRVGDEIECFVYLDQDERLIATTEKPLARVGDFAYLSCSWVNEYGAFLDWGVMKDVFCPFREQKRKMEIGESYIVYIHLDPDSYRIVATAKVDRYLNDDVPPYRHNEKVSLLVWQKTDLGFKVIVDNAYQGLVYRDQIFRHIHTGDRMDGYIDQIRPDGKLDVMLQPSGKKQRLSFAQTLFHYLQEHDGTCPFGDKSEADDIKREFQVSKKVFKKAVGELYKQRLITVEPLRLTLTEPKTADRKA